MIKVFISSTTVDLGSYRERVKDTLLSRGDVLPVEQQSFDLDYRNISRILNSQIAECDAVICLVGFAYGHGPRVTSLDERRRSYSQMEYDIAKNRHKPTYLFLATDACALDNDPDEDPERVELQRKFRNFIQGSPDIYYEFSSHDELGIKVAELRIKPFEPIGVGYQPARWYQTVARFMAIGLVFGGAYLAYDFISSKHDNDQRNEKPNPLVVTADAVEEVKTPSPQKSSKVAESKGNLMINISSEFPSKSYSVTLKNQMSGHVFSQTIDPNDRNAQAVFNNLEFGEYEIQATLGDLETTVTRRVRIESISNLAELPIQGVLAQFYVTPADATIEVKDGRIQAAELRSTGSRREQYLRPGWRTITFSRDEYESITTNVLVSGTKENRSQDIRVNLRLRTVPLAGVNWQVIGTKMQLLWISPFWMGKMEVTRNQYAAFAKDAGVDLEGGMKCLTLKGWEQTTNSWSNPPFAQTGDDPVVGVSWHEAQLFCEWMTRTERDAGRLSTNQMFRLPSLAEYDAVVVDHPLQNIKGNFAGFEVAKSTWPWPVQHSTVRSYSDHWPRTSPVGASGDLIPSNGLCDLVGNVAEWTLDAYRKDTNPERVREKDPDYFENDGGGDRYKVVFGGSWSDHDLIDLDPRVRHKAQPSERTDRIGFRIVLVDTTNSP